MLGSAKGLRELNVSRCLKLNDVSIKAVVDTCKEQLQNLQCCNTPVTDVAARLLSQCTALTNLNLSSTSITDTGVTLVAESCPLLQSLDLSFCKVTDSGALALSFGCPELRYLSLKHTTVGELGLVAIAEKCSKLEHLDASNTGVSDAAFQALMKHCQALVYLDVCACQCSTGINRRAGHPGKWQGWCREACCNLFWHLAECHIDEVNPALRTITDAALEVTR